MLFKKILLSSALISMAGFVACGDDSSSNSSTKDLPKSVPTFFDLEDVECNADRKCETIIVEDGPDTYECDGVSQWNMLISSMPSEICPPKEEKTEGDENGEDDGDKTPGSSASAASSTDSGSGKMVSCDIPGVLGECIEFEEGTEKATQLADQCVSVLEGTLGTGCAK